MLTRGRHANHLYLQAVGDGDPHTVVRPETISPPAPTETLRQILARDEAPVSAGTVLRELNDAAGRLFLAVQRYTDGLHVAAEQLVGPQTVAELDQADQYLPGLTTEPAWLTLRAQLLAFAAETGEHPLRHLLAAAAGPDLRTAGDMAAVLDWRLTALAPNSPGPLPWLPGVPSTLHADPVWGPYLAKRAQLVADLAGQVQDHACQGDAEPIWHHREAARAPPSSAKSRCGGPPTASIPTTRDQPEKEANSKRFRHCGNSASTGISPVPPIHQATQGLTNDWQHAPHLVAGGTTGSARTKHRVDVRTGQPRPVANDRRCTGCVCPSQPPKPSSIGLPDSSNSPRATRFSSTERERGLWRQRLRLEQRQAVQVGSVLALWACVAAGGVCSAVMPGR
jgi:hypothetical protein